ncbi:MAG: hypothetical protein R2713_09105 [Ilumatobacteraceae bacterium]
MLATAGSRYTYCANPLALREAKERGFSRLALVGMGCQTSSPPVMWDRKAGKVSKPFLFNIGLLCSKTFDDAIFPRAVRGQVRPEEAGQEDEHQGRLPDLMKDGSYHEIDLKECHQWTCGRAARTALTSWPSTPTRHPAASARMNDWTLTIVRTELGEEAIDRTIAEVAGSSPAPPRRTRWR